MGRSNSSPRQTWLVQKSGLILVLVGLSACGGREAETTSSSNSSDASVQDDGSNSNDAGAVGETLPEAGTGCPPDLTPQSDLVLTPRADTNLEALALKLSPGKIVADQTTYERVVRDVGAIRAQRPDLAMIGFVAPNDGRTIDLSVPAETAGQMQRGDYHAWDCLNTTYGAERPFEYSKTSETTAGVSIKLKGIYSIKLLAVDYGHLPTVTSATPGIAGADGPTICVTASSDPWHYVFDAASGDCPGGCIDHAYSHFLTQADGAVMAVEEWNSQDGGAAPPWVAMYASRSVCR